MQKNVVVLAETGRGMGFRVKSINRESQNIEKTQELSKQTTEGIYFGYTKTTK